MVTMLKTKIFKNIQDESDFLSKMIKTIKKIKKKNNIGKVVHVPINYVVVQSDKNE